MDALLEILEKYNCHLKRGSQTMSNFMDDNFKHYCDDLQTAAESADNKLVGKEMCEMVLLHLPKIKSVAEKIAKALYLYNTGKLYSAVQTAFDSFETLKNYLLIKTYDENEYYSYYRIRRAEKQLSRKDLFHIPLPLNYLASTERYSMPGHPCLYLASYPDLCWYECGKPESFAIARFDLPQSGDQQFRFVDFSEKLMPLKYAFFSWFYNDEIPRDAIRNYLLKILVTYPLRAACSVVVEHTDAKYKEEYIIPQLLVQWLVTDNDLDGIRYESSNNNDEVRRYGSHNIVLITKKYDSEGYDIKLRNTIMVGKPEWFENFEITERNPLIIEEIDYDPQFV